jgi:hypothetical protein
MIVFLPPLTPALSLRWGEREYFGSPPLFPSPQMGERVRGRRKNLINFPSSWLRTKIV